jgi:hypothetical protein
MPVEAVESFCVRTSRRVPTGGVTFTLDFTGIFENEKNGYSGECFMS